MKKLIIEVRINEYEMRERNHNVPWTPNEIARDAKSCRDAGAAIVHFHARTPSGAPDLSVDAYGEIIERIAAKTDILMNPTLGAARTDLPVPERLLPMLQLQRLPDLLPLCFSSPNWDFFVSKTRQLASTDRLYLNPTGELVESTRIIINAGIGLNCVCWDIGATRRVAAFIESGVLAQPSYLAFHLTSGGMLAGHPGTVEGLAAHTAFLPQGGTIEWAVMNLHGSMLPLAETIIRQGGHVHIGIGDYHYAELGCPQNAVLVNRIVGIARDVGREIASPAEARQILGLDRLRVAQGTG